MFAKVAEKGTQKNSLTPDLLKILWETAKVPREIFEQILGRLFTDLAIVSTENKW